MKSYPSILGPSNAPYGEHCIGFEKLDGINIRTEWSPKKGWHKFGTRKQLIDPNDLFGPAIDLFMNTQAEGIEKVFKNNLHYRNIRSAIVFLEYYGPSSFGCWHDYSEQFRLTLIDVNIHKKGFVLPSQFAKDFGHLDAAQVVYNGILTPELIEDIKNNKFNLKEGAVLKGGTKHNYWMIKVKTSWWMTELRRRAKESIEFKQLLADNEKEQKRGV